MVWMSCEEPGHHEQPAGRRGPQGSSLNKVRHACCPWERMGSRLVRLLQCTRWGRAPWKRAGQPRLRWCCEGCAPPPRPPAAVRRGGLRVPLPGKASRSRSAQGLGLPGRPGRDVEPRPPWPAELLPGLPWDLTRFGCLFHFGGQWAGLYLVRFSVKRNPVT